MILFHGTTEENVKSIRKNGLFAATKDQWLLEVTEDQNICCLSQRPVSGEGGNPLFFARSKKQNGYIVVIKIHFTTLVSEKLLAIYDNKTLDDYTQKHFFVRQEFREKGYALFQALRDYSQRDKIEDIIVKRPVTDEDAIIHTPDDQRSYYKEFREEEKRYVVEVLDLEISDEFYDFVRHIGTWSTFYEFLNLHFQKLAPEQWQKFIDDNHYLKHRQFWDRFYQTYPLEINDPRQEHWVNWFSPQWLMSRETKDLENKIHKNSQILVSSIEPEYILDIIHITTPAGLLPEFRYKAKSGTTQAIWKKVDAILGKGSFHR